MRLKTILLKFNTQLEDSKVNYYWIVAFVGLLIQYVYISYSYDNILFWETGYDYLFTAYNESYFLESLFRPEPAGYLIVLNRIISSVAAIFSPLYWPYIIHYFSMLFAIFCLTFFISRNFRGIIKSDILRMIIAIVLDTIIRGNFLNLLIFHNVFYMGMIVVLLLFFYDLEKSSKYTYLFYTIFIWLLVISKLHFILFIPFIIIAIWYHYKVSNRKSLVFWAAIMGALSIQIIHSIFRIKSGAERFSNGLFHRLQDEGYLIFLNNQIVKPIIFFFEMPTRINSSFVFLIIGIIIFTVVLYTLYKNFKKGLFNKSNLLILISILLSLMIILFTAINFLEYYLLSRGVHISYIFICLGLLVFILNYINNRFFKYLLFISFCVNILFNVGFFNNRFFYNQGIVLSWNKQYVLFEKKDFYIPHYIRKFDVIAKNNINLFFKRDNKLLSDVYKNKAKIRAVIIEYPPHEELRMVAYNEQGVEIATAKMYSYLYRYHKYFAFDGERVQAHSLKFFDKNNKEIKPEIVMIGGIK